MNDLDDLVAAAQAEFERAAAPADLENAKARFLGKAGRLTELLKGLAALPADEKKTLGAAINATKQRVEAALAARRQALADAELEHSGYCLNCLIYALNACSVIFNSLP